MKFKKRFDFVAGEALRTNGQDTLLWEKSGQQLQPLQGLWNQ